MSKYELSSTEFGIVKDILKRIYSDINAPITDIKSKINDKDSFNETTSLQVKLELYKKLQHNYGKAKKRKGMDR